VAVPPAPSRLLIPTDPTSQVGTAYLGPGSRTEAVPSWRCTVRGTKPLTHAAETADPYVACLERSLKHQPLQKVTLCPNPACHRYRIAWRRAHSLPSFQPTLQGVQPPLSGKPQRCRVLQIAGSRHRASHCAVGLHAPPAPSTRRSDSFSSSTTIKEAIKSSRRSPI
jgi:hypothetical protein